ncbi:sulfurtransferase [Sabulilitoribacter multivorans]|uniref:Sulfurtransferase n=1 Tax=Flaviramulus multivorans TaxID=1304750 RepID=A0ABS9IH63_9FLAO|nr:sulfurtransferase [Flaviramulus multivorans]MCF7560101.1 sulfurtransferase [Flaviramulus multivorans]
MKGIELNQPIVTVDWLHANLNADNLVILDGTINKVFDASQKQIPNTRLFDIKNKFSDTSNPFPSAFPSSQQFQKEARALGINNNSAIVVYDDKGIYSSARVWWLFKAFGYNNVAVLNGGFPAWLQANYAVESMKLYDGPSGNFTPNLQPDLMKFFKDVEDASKNKTHKIVDARSPSRFNGEEPEPRAGLRQGTIPNSVNLPFETLLDNGILKPKIELEKALYMVAHKNDPVIFSCGSGITACVLALGADIAGYKNISVYDGSWTEWGSLVKD